MMKESLVAIACLVALGAFSSCQADVVEDQMPPVEDKEYVITEGIRFCESTYPYKGGLLIANFGTENLDPLNAEGKGYIAYYKEGKVSRLIPVDGHLNAPKGMFEKDGYLFISDVNKIVVYKLDALTVAPQTIQLPAGELFVNDLAAKGDKLFATVTNTGTVFSIDIANKTTLASAKVETWLKVVGANGIIIDGNSMFVASYPADGVTTAENVIYRIANLDAPVAEKFITEPGQYDGITLSADKKSLYVTNWVPAGVYRIDVASKSMTKLQLINGVVGAADMTLMDGKLYIPDLPNSRVVVYPVPNN